MNPHATPKDADPSGSLQPVPEEEDSDNSCCQALSASDIEEIFRQLDEIRYRPGRESVYKIFKYAGIPPKCPD